MGYINGALGDTLSGATTDQVGPPGPQGPQGPQGPKGETSCYGACCRFNVTYCIVYCVLCFVFYSQLPNNFNFRVYFVY